MSTIDPQLFFKEGFPLEEPKVLLPWGKPLDEVAKMSGGVWQGDRYVWRGIKYLNGLDYLVASENGIDQKEPLTSVSAYIGLNKEGLWSDDITLEQYKKVANHLVELFGEPSERKANSEVPNTETLTWRVDRIEIYLDVIEQFAHKCYLTVSMK